MASWLNLQPMKCRGWLAPSERPFAEQKNMILPSWIAAHHGHTALAAQDAAAVEAAAASAFVVITATGRPGIISQHYATAPFLRAKYRANMGGEDEFGPAFESAAVMVDKKPINFAIAHPTRIRFLDPIFFAHNLGIDLLLGFTFKPGLHPFPAFMAEQILTEWETLFNVDVDALLQPLPQP
ncbi:conserved hypothetical protein [Rhodobacteraceae bacterium KLH11]|nr:conserved hypothetical protein [Rhodobacteraceae bacterium KLH11]